MSPKEARIFVFEPDETARDLTQKSLVRRGHLVTGAVGSLRELAGAIEGQLGRAEVVVIGGTSLALSQQGVELLRKIEPRLILVGYCVEGLLSGVDFDCDGRRGRIMSIDILPKLITNLEGRK